MPMRPYQLWEHGPWVDLDQVQEIHPPKFIDRMGSGGFFVEMYVYFAFRDVPRIFKWYQPMDDDTVHREVIRPKCTKSGWPTELTRMLNEVYLPLLKEWSGKTMWTGNPINYGYDERRYK